MPALARLGSEVEGLEFKYRNVTQTLDQVWYKS